MMTRKSVASLILLSGLAASPMASPMAMAGAEGQSEEMTPEARQAQQAEQNRGNGPASDPLDPDSAHTRALQLGSGSDSVTAGNRFNPGISVILDGVYYDEFSGHMDDFPGFDMGGHGHDHGHGHGHGLEQGFQLREAELAFSGSVDPYFDMFVMAALFDDGIEIEEAYVTTRALPAGLQVKAGRFLSDVGYINKQHLHVWDFVDQPLIMEHLFGEEGLRETGLQLTWMPATQTYTRLGLELFNGETEGVANYIGGGDHEMVTVLPRHTVDPNVEPGDPGADEPVRNRWRADNGLTDNHAPRLMTAFAKWAPNLSYNHNMQLGIFGGVSDAHQMSEAHSSGRLETWDGDASFYGLDAVYKYDGGGIHGHRNFTLQAEYLRRDMDLLYQSRAFSDFATLVPTTRGGDDDVVRQSWQQDGLYIQGIYGIAPRWNVGLRIDALGLTNDAYADEDEGRGLPVEYEPSYRYALQTTFAPTEFSRIRAQVNYSEFGEEHGHHGHGHDEGAWEFMLQYNISLGVHGAHAF